MTTLSSSNSQVSDLSPLDGMRLTRFVCNQTRVSDYLDEVAKAGYQWTELGPYGYLPTDLATLRSELGARSLKVTAIACMVHLEEPESWPGLGKQLLGGGELVASLAGRFVVLMDDTYSDLFTGQLTQPKRLDDAAWKRLLDTTHRAADLVQSRFDLQLVYHPHAETHVEYEDQIERFLEQTDPARVGLCLDTGHHAYRGGDPVAFFRKHHRRIPYLHLKSVDPDKQAWVARDQIPFGLAVASDMFCEPSQGSVDFTAFRDALIDVGYDGWATVEQDMYPTPFDKPFPIAQRTRVDLQEIGIG